MGRLANSWHHVRHTTSSGSLDTNFWCVLANGIRHRMKYSKPSFYGGNMTVNTYCDYGSMRMGHDAQVALGVPNCLACAAL